MTKMTRCPPSLPREDLVRTLRRLAAVCAVPLSFAKRHAARFRVIPAALFSSPSSILCGSMTNYFRETVLSPSPFCSQCLHGGLQNQSAVGSTGLCHNSLSTLGPANLDVTRNVRRPHNIPDDSHSHRPRLTQLTLERESEILHCYCTFLPRWESLIEPRLHAGLYASDQIGTSSTDQGRWHVYVCWTLDRSL